MKYSKWNLFSYLVHIPLAPVKIPLEYLEYLDILPIYLHVLSKAKYGL